MNYNEFVNYVKDNITEYISALTGQDAKTYTVSITHVEKNNGIKLDGITLRHDMENVCPNIYLNGFFDKYKMGTPITSILDELALYYTESMKEADMFENFDLTHFDSIKNNIVLRLVNYDMNKEALENAPHKKILDLAATFRYVANARELGIASCLISNREFSLWNIEIEQLYEIALANTMRMFPKKLCTLGSLLKDIMCKENPALKDSEISELVKCFEEDNDHIDVYVLTNDCGINGATSVLYENVLADFANKSKKSFYILPSSVHEVMLVPDINDLDASFLSGLVCEVNKSSVGLIDLLSDNIYYYDKDDGKLSLKKSA